MVFGAGELIGPSLCSVTGGLATVFSLGIYVVAWVALRPTATYIALGFACCCCCCVGCTRYRGGLGVAKQRKLNHGTGSAAPLLAPDPNFKIATPSGLYD